MHRAVTDADAPNLSVRQSRQKTLGCGNHVLGKLMFTRVNIDRDDLAAIAVFHLGAYLPLVDVLSALRMFFLAVSRLPVPDRFLWCRKTPKVNVISTMARLL